MFARIRRLFGMDAPATAPARLTDLEIARKRYSDMPVVEDHMIPILVCNNSGAGYMKWETCPIGTTYATVAAQHNVNEPEKYYLALSRPREDGTETDIPVTPTTRLRAGDRLMFNPAKMAAGR